MDVIKYKEFEISTATHQLPNTGEWTLAVVLTRHHDDRNCTLAGKFSAANTFKTKGEASSHCIEFGKQIIDGQHPNLSICDLV